MVSNHIDWIPVAVSKGTLEGELDEERRGLLDMLAEGKMKLGVSRARIERAGNFVRRDAGSDAGFLRRMWE